MIRNQIWWNNPKINILFFITILQDFHKISAKTICQIMALIRKTKQGDSRMYMNFNHKGIDFEFQIERIDIEYPNISIVFENEQNMHHFQSILKEHNGKEHDFEFEHEDEFTIKAPLEFIDKIDVNFQE